MVLLAKKIMLLSEMCEIEMFISGINEPITDMFVHILMVVSNIVIFNNLLTFFTKCVTSIDMLSAVHSPSAWKALM